MMFTYIFTNKKKCINLIITFLVIALVIASVIFLVINDNNIGKAGNANDSSDVILPSNVNFIDSSESDNFIYDVKVILNKTKDEHGFLKLQYLMTMTNKLPKEYKNIHITAFLDESMKDIIIPQTFLGFGTNVDDKINLTSDSKGIKTGRVTVITDYLGLDEITKRLNKEIKVEVHWDNNEEYVIVNPENIHIEYIE